MPSFPRTDPRLLILAAILLGVCFSYGWIDRDAAEALPAPKVQTPNAISTPGAPPLGWTPEDRAPSSTQGSADLLAAPDATDQASTTPRLQFGSLKGRLFNSDTSVIPNGRITFIFEGREEGAPRSPFANSRTVKTNEHGEYEAKLSSGPWSAHYAGLPTEGSIGFTNLGNVRIQAHQDHTLDLFIQGQRNFAGGFYYKDLDNVLLKLDLHLEYDGNIQVGSADCLTSTEDYAEYLEAIEEERPDVPRKVTPRPPGLGGFYLGHLPADIYEMRVYLDVPKTLYITARVDLREGDLIFAPIELREVDFVTHRTFQL